MTAVVAYTDSVMRGKYRLRTWLRGNAPGPLSALFPKGTSDCGDHEWYREDRDSDACYHCEVGRRPHEYIAGEDRGTEHLMPERTGPRVRVPARF